MQTTLTSTRHGKHDQPIDEPTDFRYSSVWLVNSHTQGLEAHTASGLFSRPDRREPERPESVQAMEASGRHAHRESPRCANSRGRERPGRVDVTNLLHQAIKHASEIDPSAIERFYTKYIPRSADECWLWLDPLNRKGYGMFWLGARAARSSGAHRVSYILAKGSIPDRMVIDHLCRNRACVNPDHLEAVTNRENIQRGETGRTSPERPRRLAQVCRNGHERVASNILQVGAYKYCRICRTASQKRSNAAETARRRAAAAAAAVIDA